MIDLFRFLGRVGRSTCVRRVFVDNLTQPSLSVGDVITCDTGNFAYTLSEIALNNGGTARLRRVKIIEENTGTPVVPDVELWFLRSYNGSAPSVPAPNAAVTLPDAYVLEKKVTIAAADWTPYAGVTTRQIADKDGLDVMLQSSSDGRDLFVVPVLGGAATVSYASTDLEFRFYFERD